jgi:hypothetical protein
MKSLELFLEKSLSKLSQKGAFRKSKNRRFEEIF